tara:strand:- start:1542 stop:1883 length:342 start_codon:yes stop_codon:yes gene_type:complete
MISEDIIKIALNIIKKNNITYSEFTNHYEPNYNVINNIWKKYKIKNSSPVSKTSFIKFFQFHLNSPVDHGIMYYANKSDNALILFKISDIFFSTLIPTHDLPIKHRNFIAIYC